MNMSALSQQLVLVPQLQQRLVLSPELRQSLKILQMSATSFMEHIREMEADNPLLEVEWPDACRLAARSGAKHSGKRMSASGEFPYAAAAGATLEQILASQIRLADASAQVKRAARYLAGNLNDDGYLVIPLAEAAAELGMPLRIVEESLRLLQSLDPAGIGARNLAECLLLQAARDPDAPVGFERLASSQLTNVAKGRWQEISRSLGLSREQVLDAVRYLRRLNPRPGLPYAVRVVPYVVPEARLALTHDGRTEIRYAGWSYPKIAVRTGWREMEGGTSAWRSWLERKRREAERLAASVAFREHTIRAVIRAIAEEQQAFLAKGSAAIRPLTLQKVASRIGCHTSTVSRAVRDKFVETVYGVLPLERFFSSRLDSEDGDEVSSRAVKCRIRSLIEHEDKERPMSDRDLAEALQREGIRISRRTVAKYRAEEKLLPASLR